MLIFITTVVLVLIAGIGWLFLKSDPDRYIHEKTSPMNFFFKWGRIYHHFFKIAIIAIFILIIFFVYKYLLNASNYFSLVISLLAGFGLAVGKELLDKEITRDDVFSSLLGILLGAIAAFFFL